MKKILLTAFVLVTGIYALWGQDVIYTISGLKNGQTTHLDSILIENLENKTRLILSELPERDSYEINLTKQGLVSVFEPSEFDRHSMFAVVRSIPGEVDLQITSEFIDNTLVNVYNMGGQLIFSQTLSDLSQESIINLKIPGPGIYILSLNTQYGAANYKVVGSTEYLNVSMKQSPGSSQNLNQNLIEARLKSVMNNDGFAFQEGDSLRITAFLGGYFTYPHGSRIYDSRAINFEMIRSKSDSTGISDRYNPIPEGTYSVLNYDTIAGTTSLLVTNDTIDFVPGDILTLDLDTTGLIQRVVDIRIENDEIILETETAYMDELFVNQSFKLNTVIMEPKVQLKSDASPLEIMKALTDDDGFIRPVKIIYHDNQGKKYEKSFLDGYKEKEHRENIISFIEDFSKTDLYGRAGRDVHFYIDEGFAKLHADAVFEFDFVYDGEITEDTKVKRGDLNFFEFYLDAEAGFQTKLALDMKKSLKEEDKDRIFRMKRATAKFYVPPSIPVWITFSCDIYSFYNFSADASLHANWGFECNHTLQAGGKYERATNEFTPIYNYTPHNEIYPLNIDGEVNASARVEIYPRVDARLYGFFGPFAEIAPYVQGNYNAKLQSQITSSGQETFLGWNSGIDLGLDLRVGTSLRFLLYSRDYGPTTINCFNLPLWASPVNIELLSNIPEQANPGQELEIQVKITDLLNLPVPLCVVYFEGDGNFSKQLPLTDVNGVATLSWMLDETAGKKTFTATIYNAEQSIVKQIVGETKTSHNGQPVAGVTDIDGNFYPSVIIGNQEWMAKNLRVTRYKNGDIIPTDLDNTDWEETKEGAYGVYPHTLIHGLDTEIEVVKTYGKLYNWYAVADTRGLCPIGWHVPSDAEWVELMNYVVAQGYPNSNTVNGAGNALKSCRQVFSPLGGNCVTSEHPRWDSDDTNHGIDAFGFSALPGGIRAGGGSYGDVGTYGYWWSSEEGSAIGAWEWDMSYGYGGISRDYGDKWLGASIRCLRDIKDSEITTHTLIITPNPTDAGKVTGTGYYTEGQTVTISATPNESYQFINWTGDTDQIADANASSTNLTMLGQDANLTANFEEEGGDWPKDTETEVVEVLNLTTGKTWMDRNLGATRAATSSTDAEAYGDLYQWGRAADGHQKRTSGTTSTLSNSDTPGHGDFITSTSGANWDWRSPQNTNLWQGVNGTNNPCPAGYRLPTEAELNAERQSWSSNNAAGAFASPLKLPVAGLRYLSLGSLNFVGSSGHYWSSSVDGTLSRRLRFGSVANMSSDSRAVGCSVRCLKD